MKVFLGFDVLLDLLLGREPYLDDFKWIVGLSLGKKYKLYTSSFVIANIHYLVSKTISVDHAYDKLIFISTEIESPHSNTTHKIRVTI